ncbi:hypothetical protein QN277_000120 [Acacia crassicarpa]|uniref:Uncharacterized protein n=1 Tax=Acacia crassicarpa TaxID=499986 RepID=A0AAE1N5S3_9FABA|nr:hypothetical protein QN277_000120 [Acacia crassicarpa]
MKTMLFLLGMLAVSVVNENLYVYIELQGSISAEAELGKIKKKIDEFKKQKEMLEKTINASGYREKVPSKYSPRQ